MRRWTSALPSSARKSPFILSFVPLISATILPLILPPITSVLNPSRNRSEPEYGVTCKHGPEECLGNIHELCAIAHTPSSQQWWPFLQCINYEGSSRIGLDKVSRDCAAVSGIDWEGSGIAKCVSGKEGRKLLRKSIKRTKKMGIK